MHIFIGIEISQSYVLSVKTGVVATINEIFIETNDIILHYQDGINIS